MPSCQPEEESLREVGNRVTGKQQAELTGEPARGGEGMILGIGKNSAGRGLRKCCDETPYFEC